MLDRRGFLKSLGGGLLVLSAFDDAIAQESGRHRDGKELPQNVAAWLHIGPDGTIAAFTGKVEVGQNIRTSLTQAVADELRCDPASVTLIMGDTDLVPWDMGTFGSRTTPTMAPVMRQMAGAAREALLDAAAADWKTERSDLKLLNGEVRSSAGKSKGIGELAAKIDWVKVTGSADAITPATQWTQAGTSLPKLNAREFVTGKHKYVSDHKLSGMLYGKVLRAPSFGAKLLAVDTTAADKLPGVMVVHDGDFAGVAATDEQLAEKALSLIQPKWQEPASQIQRQPAYSGWGGAELPDVTRVQSSYQVAYIAHVPLEPRATVAEWTGGRLSVWTGTQVPFGVRSELAAAFNITERDVRVRVPDTGSGYGGKHSGECAVEAARLAKAAGKPVKLIWTRQEEFTWAYVRPEGVIKVESGADKAGKLQSWSFTNFYSGPAGLHTPYEVTVKKEDHVSAEGPLREGSYRGLASTANHFARESHMDEMAAKLRLNPLEFRLLNLKNERLQTVLQKATDQFGWAKQKASSTRGFGLACGADKGGYVACCAEVSTGEGKEGKQVKVERVVVAWECGAIVNPEHLRNQVEGSILMGLGGALFEAIEHANGRILNPRLSSYRVPRFGDAPKVEVILVDRKDLPSAGAGEIPIVGIAPAIANAIFSATGIRVRSMPMLPALAKA